MVKPCSDNREKHKPVELTSLVLRLDESESDIEEVLQ